MGKWWVLFGLLLLVFTIEGIGGFWTRSLREGWYDELPKPSWTPPNWVFGYVWTVLYASIALSGWLAWCRIHAVDRSISLPAFVLYFLQLLLNLFWSYLFFQARLVGWACLELFFLWVSIGMTIRYFYQIFPLSAWLLLPYWAWVTYAFVLNCALLIAGNLFLK